MSGPWVFAADSSYDELTDEEAQRLKAAGCKLFIQCTWTGHARPAVALDNLIIAHRNGLAIAIYFSLNGDSNTGSWHADSGTNGISDEIWEALKFAAVDVELPNIYHQTIREACEFVRGYGKKPVVYTSYNAWRNYVIPPNPPAPRWYDGVAELWNAYWDQNPDVDFASLPFGDWTPDEVIMEQWSGGTYVEGQYVDRNTLDASKLPGLLAPIPLPPAPEPEPGPPPGVTIEEARTAWSVVGDFLGGSV